VDESRLDAHLENWVQLLEALRDKRLNIDRARVMPNLNHALDTLIMEN